MKLIGYRNMHLPTAEFLARRNVEQVFQSLGFEFILPRISGTLPP
jgi:hypothetical protein